MVSPGSPPSRYLNVIPKSTYAARQCFYAAVARSAAAKVRARTNERRGWLDASRRRVSARFTTEQRVVQETSRLSPLSATIKSDSQVSEQDSGHKLAANSHTARKRRPVDSFGENYGESRWQAEERLCFSTIAAAIG